MWPTDYILKPMPAGLCTYRQAGMNRARCLGLSPPAGSGVLAAITPRLGRQWQVHREKISRIVEVCPKCRPWQERAQAGEEVVIARAGKPVARLTAIAAAADSRSGVRFGGIKPSKLKLTADFHTSITDDDLLNP